MTMGSREITEALRVYYEEEIEGMIRRMKIEGGTLEDCTRELHLLADFVRAQADGLAEAWPELLHDTRCGLSVCERRARNKATFTVGEGCGRLS
jgi:hypothetical protein